MDNRTVRTWNDLNPQERDACGKPVYRITRTELIALEGIEARQKILAMETAKVNAQSLELARSIEDRLGLELGTLALAHVDKSTLVIVPHDQKQS